MSGADDVRAFLCVLIARSLVIVAAILDFDWLRHRGVVNVAIFLKTLLANLDLETCNEIRINLLGKLFLEVMTRRQFGNY